MTISIRAIVALALAMSCKARDDGAPAGAPSSAASASAAQQLDESARPYVFGPWWERAAASGDALDLAELAQREGAVGLVHGLDDPKYAQVACAALPSTGDAMLALQPLAAQLKQGNDEQAARSGQTILDILSSQTVQYGERLDPEGELAAVADLQSVAADPNTGARRQLAIGALARLCEERRLCDPASVPAD